ncbi:MAG TPA: hypothetical protein VHT29_11480 [Solirubrobacteraceae bacterium]|nr:hypothetical protein [Solirubrobacteraceae bacterium]
MPWVVLVLAATVVAVAVWLPSPALAAIIDPSPPERAPPGLPDGRVYELVSPLEKGGSEAGIISGGEGGYGLSSADGERVLYASSGAIGQASSGVDNFSVSERTPTGWRTSSAVPQPVPSAGERDPIELSDPTSLLASADLGSVTFTADDPFTPSGLNFANPKFAFGSFYLSNGGGPATWIGAPTAEHPVPALEEVKEQSDLALVGASPDLSTIYFEYYGTLVQEDEPRVPAVAGGSLKAWGLYEWHEGHLKSAGLLPAGEAGPGEVEDPYGAVAAGIGNSPVNVTAPDYDNEVSQSGNTLLFVSPAPEASPGQPSQLYARLDGKGTVLVSRSELTGKAATHGVVASVGLSQSATPFYAYGSPDGSRVFFASEDQLTTDAPADTSIKEYEFNLQSGSLTYLLGVTQPVIASSQDGSVLAFDDASTHGNELAIWDGGHITDITALPGEGVYVTPVRFAGGNSSLIFSTNASVPGFNDGEGYAEVYRYELASTKLTCISCPPKGVPLTGSAELSNDALHHPIKLLGDSRSVTEDGSEIFFDTPARLVPQDQNGVRDVYEWHNGTLSLISSGAGTTESLFLDNSPSGNNVFIATQTNLTGSDTDGGYDVYDARVGGGFPTASSAAACARDCAGSEAGASPPSALASTIPLGPGEQLAPPPLGHTAAPLTRAQKLARSLKACRKLGRRRRGACERKARQRYGKHRGGGRA